MQGFFRPRALAIFAAESALSPEEWIAVRRADVDRTQGVVRVERTAVDGEEKPVRLDRLGVDQVSGLGVDTGL